TNIRWNYENEDLKTLSNEVTIKSKEEQTTFDFIAATKSQVTLDETVSAKDRLDFMPGAKDIDIVYEILLRQRDIPLSAKVELLEDIGKRTYIFADSYLVCLEENITVELIEKLAERNPLP
ncbi:site-specific DNA-methyltransferase, partial [Clostridium saudiense]|nr:site-specific DNA-methyltransferase [Clostridium saudiense]